MTRCQSEGPENAIFKYDPNYEYKTRSLQRFSKSEPRHISEYSLQTRNEQKCRREINLEGNLIPSQCDMMTIKNDMNNDAASYIFWSCSLFLFIIAILNLIVLLLIMNSLGLSLSGFHDFEILRHNGGIKFLKDVEFENLNIGSGILSGFDNESLCLSSNSEIGFSLTNNSEKLVLSSEAGLVFKNIKYLRIVDSKTGALLFDSSAPSLQNANSKLESLSLSQLTVGHRLVAPLGKDLSLHSDSQLSLLGVEGLSGESQNIIVDAGNDIRFTSEKGDLVFDSQDIRLYPLPLETSRSSQHQNKHFQNKVCICLPSGILYTIPEDGVVSCEDSSYSPC